METPKLKDVRKDKYYQLPDINRTYKFILLERGAGKRRHYEKKKRKD